jgi:hypothetical protein
MIVCSFIIHCFLVHNKCRDDLKNSLLSFRCIADGKCQQAMGMAVECRRLDKLDVAISQCDNVYGALSYCINLSHQYVNHREYRCEV